MLSQNSVMNILIGKNIARQATTLVDNSSATFLANGEIVVCDASGTILDTTTVLNKKSVFIVEGQGTSLPLIWSDEIFRDKVWSFTGTAYTAGTVQIDYIGYNSVQNLGSIDVINDNDYTIELFDIDSTTFGSLGVSKLGFYTSDSTATEQEIAIGLTESMFTNTRDLVFRNILVEMVSDGTFAAATSTHTLVNGSPNVVAAGANTVVAGDLIRVTTNTDLIAIYYIEAKGVTAFPGAGANDFRLNIPYQGVSVAGATLFRQTVAPATGFGIRITGRAPYFQTPYTTTYHVNRWKTNLYRMGSTPIATEQNATEGSGEYEQVAQIEQFLLGNEGHTAREGVVPYIAPRSRAVSTADYSIICLAHSRMQDGFVMQQPVSYKQLMLAFDKNGGFIANSQATTNASNNSVEEVLEAWLSTFSAISI